jgi:hypothetical protein
MSTPRLFGVVLGLCAASGGCTFNAPAAAVSPEAGVPGDDLPEAGLPSVCVGGFVQVCVAAEGLVERTLADQDVNTDLACDATVDGTAIDACVLAGTSITVNGVVTAHGARPLVLLAATGGITVGDGGRVDVSSHRIGDVRGAGADPAGCAGLRDAIASAGGYGGSYRGRGGNGGDSAIDDSGGLPSDSVTLMRKLAGGCPGGAGAGATSTRGRGGGAVALIAKQSITIAGTLAASGASGGGGPANMVALRGGGGGGAGGMIVLDGASVSFNQGPARVIVAKGGGGGEGGRDVAAGGTAEDPALDLEGTDGGNAGGNGGNGGEGSPTADGEGGSDASSGGGGGGGVGFIVTTVAPVGTPNAAPAVVTLLNDP